MNNLFLAANNGMGNVWTIAIFIGLIALMYFTMIKPQKKQQQKKMEMMNELKKGDHVVLIDGLHGKIDSVNTQDKTVVVDADGIYLTFSRMAVQQILPEAPALTQTPAASSDRKAEPTAPEAGKAEAPADKPEADKQDSKAESEQKSEKE